MVDTRDSGQEALRLVRQLMAQLGLTATGVGIQNGVEVVPINGERTDTAGVPDGAVNYYIDAGSLWHQVFSFDEQAWFKVEMT